MLTGRKKTNLVVCEHFDPATHKLLTSRRWQLVYLVGTPQGLNIRKVTSEAQINLYRDANNLCRLLVRVSTLLRSSDLMSWRRIYTASSRWSAQVPSASSFSSITSSKVNMETMKKAGRSESAGGISCCQSYLLRVYWRLKAWSFAWSRIGHIWMRFVNIRLCRIHACMTDKCACYRLLGGHYVD